MPDGTVDALAEHNTELALMKKTPIERQILDYLRKYPAAQDTVEGIVEWWFLKQKIEQTTDDVVAALAKLVAQGKLIARTGPDSRVHYCHHQRAANKRFQNK